MFQGPLADPGDPMFWAPLISLLGSLREEEALQLRTDDVVEIDGIPCFDVKIGPNQRLKSAAAIRRVPVHRDLITLGLLELVELRRRQGEVRLFPHLKRGRNREALSEEFTKDFTRHRKRNGIFDPRIDFHSFRTTFNVEFVRNRVDNEVRCVLMGHVVDHVNIVHYGGGGYSLEHLRDVVNSIRIDVSAIRPPFEDRRGADVVPLRRRENGAPGRRATEPAACDASGPLH